MILFAVLLATLDVFVISQVDFWGITPLIFAALLYAYRYNASALEIVVSGAIYGFVVGTFQAAAPALVTLLSYVLGAALAIGLLRTVGQSRYRIKMKGYDAALLVVSFTGGFWLVMSLFSLDAVLWSRSAVFVLWSMAFNLLLMICIELVSRKVAIR